MVDSIEAVVHRGDRDRNHLTLDPAQRGLATHQVRIQSHVVFQGRRVQRMDSQDVIHFALGSPVSPIQLGEWAYGRFVFNVRDVRQGPCNLV